MYKLPPLPYAFGALEPYIDALTMEIHHDRHHQAYINNLNTALEKYPALQKVPLKELLENLDDVPADIRTTVRNNGGGTFNHDMFWTIMSPNGGGKPTGKIADEINKIFGSFEAMQEQFNTAAKTVFGSGWAWLCLDLTGKLVIMSTANQDTPLSVGLSPVMGLDVWEHAYYLKYQNKRPDYITAWWHVTNWEQVEENYRALVE
ncbi:MAG TPA: superoxide dismutase [Candidatus Dependentiae bacterium]|nr:superoxide dismutase [Candidatus Dependentiae bacterium]HRQ62633.1 superoxide dismutase [Candidatus Dependentiae bacterium]